MAAAPEQEFSVGQQPALDRGGTSETSGSQESLNSRRLEPQSLFSSAPVPALSTLRSPGRSSPRSSPSSSHHLSPPNPSAGQTFPAELPHAPDPCPPGQSSFGGNFSVTPRGHQQQQLGIRGIYPNPGLAAAGTAAPDSTVAGRWNPVSGPAAAVSGLPNGHSRQDPPGCAPGPLSATGGGWRTGRPPSGSFRPAPAGAGRGAPAGMAGAAPPAPAGIGAGASGSGGGMADAVPSRPAGSGAGSGGAAAACGAEGRAGDGPAAFKYQEVVRKAAERQLLQGIACADCRRFYEACNSWRSGAQPLLEPVCGHVRPGECLLPAVCLFVDDCLYHIAATEVSHG